MNADNGFKVMISTLGRFYAYIFGRAIFYKFNKFIAYLGLRGMGLINYENLHTSGEFKLIDNYILNNKEKKIIFDVGANSASWSTYIYEKGPNNEFHLFEPSLILVEEIKRLNKNFIVSQCAVGEAVGTITMHDYQDSNSSSHASAVSGVIETLHKKASKSYNVPMTTLDQYCIDAGIHSIDFLKIDVEGFELDVLKGAKAILSKKKIQCIQFEFNEMMALRGHHFLDFWDMLSNDYLIYRVLSSGLLPISKYQPLWTELYGFQNIFAILKNKN